MADDSTMRIRNATKEDIPVIKRLAYSIWPSAYKEILSPKQLDYMLKLIYSEASLQKQFDRGHHFLVAEENNEPIAFADYNLLKESVYKLQKIYVINSQQGKGIGKILIDHIIQKIKV